MLKDGRTGIEAARPDLFQESVLCLMPSPDADPKAVETAVNFGRILGAAPYFVDPAEYDGLVQGVETIPGLMAAAMFDAVHGAAGWRDILRFADLPFAQVTAPLQTGPELARFAMRNRIAALRWLDALMSNLADVRSLIQEKDEERLEALVADLEQKRAAWLLEREENNWVEVQGADVGPPGLSEQMMGSWLSGRLRNED
jgi:prephenate dehydrogenase